MSKKPTINMALKINFYQKKILGKIPNLAKLTKLKILKILFFTSLFLASTNSFAFNYNRKITLEKQFKDFGILGDIEYRNKEKKLNHRHYDLGIIFPEIHQNLNILLKYRQAYRKLENFSNNEWYLYEKRPQFQVSYDFYENQFFELKTRFRHEFRIFERNNENRSRLRFNMISRKATLKLKPFILNEFFFNHNEGRFSKNRVDIGLIFSNFKNFAPAIVYRLESDYDQNLKGFKNENMILFRIDIDI
jgi:hypothetical protein